MRVERRERVESLKAVSLSLLGEMRRDKIEDLREVMVGEGDIAKKGLDRGGG